MSYQPGRFDAEMERETYWSNGCGSGHGEPHGGGDEKDEPPPGGEQSPLTPKPFVLRTASDLPTRQWLYANHLIRGFVSATVAPGGLGKSSMSAVEALSMVTGRALLGDAPPKPLRVWMWNGEDPFHELERRIAAACLHHSIAATDIADRLMVDSGRDLPIKLATMGRQGVSLARPIGDALITALLAAKVDVLVIDPFVASHEVVENDNTAINAVIAESRRIADAAGCAVELVHHVSKAGALGGDDLGIYAARGAGALIDGVRSARYLTRMRPEDAGKFGIEDPQAHFRVTMGKANLAPAEKATWRKIIGISLGNGAGLWPLGDSVGVCIAWTPPDAFEGMTCRDLKRVQDAIAAAQEPPKENERAGDWVGFLIAAELGLDAGRDLKKTERNASQNMARAKVRQLLSGWLKSGALIVDATHSARDGREVKVIAVGDPVTTADLASAA